MTRDGSIRFSIQLPNAASGSDWTEKVRRAEDLGFYSLSVPDHLGPSLPQLAPLVALAAAANVTSRVRLAVTVLDNDFRHPVMLAKEIATLDVLSGGRVDMGLGAGWLQEDYTKTGLASWDPAGTRVGRLFESVRLLRELFTGEPVTFKGEYYRVDDFQSFPRPLQSPVPLLIGGAGKRMLTMAAREANIISLILDLGGSPDSRRAAFEEQLAWIVAAGAEERSDLMVGVRVLFGDVGPPRESRRAVGARLEGLRGQWGMSEIQEVIESPFGLVGDLEAIKDHVIEVHERYGISYFTVSEDLAWKVAPVVGALNAS
jgi:probable F420-dependent oxidoreductase